MSILDDVVFNKKIKTARLMVYRNDKGNVLLYAELANSDTKILLRKFKGYSEYERFITEAAFLRLVMPNKTIRDIRDKYGKLVDGLSTLDEVRKDDAKRKLV